MTPRGLLPFLGAAVLCLAGCRQEMHDQPRLEAFAQSDFFEDGMAMRPLPKGVVPVGDDEAEVLRTGLMDGFLATKLPLELRSRAAGPGPRAL